MEAINRMQARWKDFKMSKDQVATNSCFPPSRLLLLKGLWQHGEKGFVLLDPLVTRRPNSRLWVQPTRGSRCDMTILSKQDWS